MSAGDNFDTAPPGYKGYKTKRQAGGGSINQAYMSGSDYTPQGLKSDDNLGHPCNAGCGCKEVCEPNLSAIGDTGCLLPPELTIRVAQAGSRQGARDQFGLTEGVDFKTYHLKYSNGTWRGRRCCKTGKDSAGNLIDFCDPCSITTHADGTKSDCIYSGREGSTREAPMGTPKGNIADRSRGSASRANETFMGPMPGTPPYQTTATPGLPDPTAGVKDWFPQPRLFDENRVGFGKCIRLSDGADVTSSLPVKAVCSPAADYQWVSTCLEDGSVVGYTKPYCHVKWGGGFFYNEDSKSEKLNVPMVLRYRNL